MWKHPSRLEANELTCEEDTHRVYNGGVYHPTPSVFQRLDDERIHVVDILRFYLYRATFDFECFFNGENRSTDTDHIQWVTHHALLSISEASNVQVYEAPRCFVTDGNSNKLVAGMMKYLQIISDVAFKFLKPSYKSELASQAAHRVQTITAHLQQSSRSGSAVPSRTTEPPPANPFATLY